MAMLIGLGGYAFSGKDAFADVLEKNHGWYKTYMSKALRESLEVLNPIVEFKALKYAPIQTIRFKEAVDALGYEEAKKLPEVRALLQRMGTEVGRKLWDENFWVNLCFNDIEKHLNEGENVVVTGIRYPNELQHLRMLNGAMVWVSRPEYGAVNTHSSDNSLSKSDFTFEFQNNETLEDLDHSVPKFVLDIVGTYRDPNAQRGSLIGIYRDGAIPIKRDFSKDENDEQSSN